MNGPPRKGILWKDLKNTWKQIKLNRLIIQWVAFQVPQQSVERTETKRRLVRPGWAQECQHVTGWCRERDRGRESNRGGTEAGRRENHKRSDYSVSRNNLSHFPGSKGCLQIPTLLLLLQKEEKNQELPHGFAPGFWLIITILVSKSNWVFLK